MYQALFVHTVGFFELLGETTKLMPEGLKFTYQMKIWRVYMILLEYACKTDYEMITRHRKCPSFLPLQSRGSTRRRWQRLLTTTRLGLTSWRLVRHCTGTKRGTQGPNAKTSSEARPKRRSSASKLCKNKVRVEL